MRASIAAFCLLAISSTSLASTVKVMDLGFNCEPSVSDVFCLEQAKKPNSGYLNGKVKSATLVSNADFYNKSGDLINASPAIVVVTEKGKIVLTKESALRLGMTMGDLLNEFSSPKSNIILRYNDESRILGLVLAIEKK